MSSGLGASLVFAWDHAHFFLAFGRFLTSLVPALVELAFVFVGPHFGDMVRGVDGARCVIHEKGLVRRHRLLRLDPIDRLVGHIDGEVIAFRFRRIHFGNAVVDQWIPLIRLAADEAIELVESLMGRPAIERGPTRWSPRPPFRATCQTRRCCSH